MQTVAQPTIKAKYAHLYDQAVTILKVPAGLFVLYEDSRIEPFEIEMAPFCTILGDVDLADGQHLEDLMNGGAVGVALRRDMEVR